MEMIELCSKPISIDAKTLQISISIGVALLSSDIVDRKTLMKNADIAMYHAKSQGYNKYQFYDQLLSYSINRNHEIELLLRRADFDQDFELLKWNHTVSNQLKIGFNISPKQLNDENFIDYLKSLIAGTGVDAVWIDADKVASLFGLLKNLGISISIDDFGAGYSSLGYLNRYPFDKIKIHKSLIDNISGHNINGQNVVKAIIDMAKAVGVKTIAEGVETQEQLEILTELGCDQVQGYYFSRPVPAEIFEKEFLKI